MEANVPNLDALTSSDLWDFWSRHQRGRKAKDLFPMGGRGSRLATARLANYASNKAVAQDLRAKGDIQTALAYEGICARIYAGLPMEAQW